MSRGTDEDFASSETIAETQPGAVSGPTLGDPTVDADSLPGHIGRFAIRGRLGAGGMGTVFEGYDAELDRRIAIKVVNRGGAVNHERLLREAQALARVSHPNVVPVFEVGTHRDAVFIAMEFVDGETLDAWRERLSPSWRETLEVFIRAGQGLAAAHAAGLVHRDFKPDNVMIGRDGRVRVMDFGLVRGADEADGPASGSAEADTSVGADASADERARNHDADGPDPGSSRTPAALRLAPASLRGGGTGRFSETLTHAGALLGTPAYMSPEQFQRLNIDARSDQFSFCVALYEALEGVRPFAGRTVVALARAVIEGETRPPPPDSRVPAWLRRCVMRGLSADPADRWPDMTALLEALADDPTARRRKRLGLAAGGVLVAVLTGLAFAPREVEGPRCTEGARRMSTIWSDDVADRVAAAYGHDASAYVGGSLEATRAGLDTYAGRVGEALDSLCAEYHRAHAISDEAFDLRGRCLEARAEALGAVVGELERGDLEAVEHVGALLATLPPVDGCADVEGLRAGGPPPPESVEAVAEVRSELASRRAQLAAARYDGLAGALADLRARAQALDYAPLVAEAALLHAEVPTRVEGPGMNAAHEAAQAAARAGDPSLEARAFMRLSMLADDPNADRRDVSRLRWQTLAEAKLDRLGWPPELEIEWRRLAAINTRGIESAEVPLGHLERVLELVEARYESPSVQRGQAYAELGSTYAQYDRADLANDYLSRARTEYAATVGEHHPLMGRVFEAAARAAVASGNFELQRDLLRRARDIYAEVFGENDEAVIQVLDNLAISYDLEGNRDRARELLIQALELRGERERSQTFGGFQALNSLCFIEYKLGHLAQARRECERAQAGLEGIVPSQHPARAIVLNNLGLIARAEGEPARALEFDRAALDITLQSVGPEHSLTAYSYVGIGESLLALGRPDEAVAPLNDALAARGEGMAEPGELGEAQCLLARALPVEARARAVQLASEGSEELAAAGPNWAPQTAACRAWLRDAQPLTGPVNAPDDDDPHAGQSGPSD